MSFDVLTFDCYGTLIDWETGILAAMRPIVEAHRSPLPDAQLLTMYGELEAAIESGPYLRYRDVLAAVVRGFGARLGFTPTDCETAALAESLPSWPVFADTRAALVALAARFRLGIVSNTDEDLFAESARRIGVPFDSVTTAEAARAYKPSHAIFERALGALDRTRVLHVGQSIYHDVVPARALGLATVLVERRGAGAAKPVEGAADFTVSDLQSLADWLL